MEPGAGFLSNNTLPATFDSDPKAVAPDRVKKRCCRPGADSQHV